MKYITRENSNIVHRLRNQQADDETAVSLCGIIAAGMWRVEVIVGAQMSRYSVCGRCAELAPPSEPMQRAITTEDAAALTAHMRQTDTWFNAMMQSGWLPRFDLWGALMGMYHPVTRGRIEGAQLGAWRDLNIVPPMPAARGE